MISYDIFPLIVTTSSTSNDEFYPSISGKQQRGTRKKWQPVKKNKLAGPQEERKSGWQESKFLRLVN